MGTRLVVVGVLLAVAALLPGLASDMWASYAQWRAAQQLAAAGMEDEPRMLVPDSPFVVSAPPARTLPDGPEDLDCPHGCAVWDDDAEVCSACRPASREPSGVDDGAAVGRIVSDAIGLDAVLVYGTSDAALRNGPGWMAGSAWLGEPGNTVVSGHRTTYGAPFNRVDELEMGDEIVLSQADGPDAVYEVRDVYIVDPDEVGVTASTRGARLTLTSCHPKGFATERIIVQAELVDGEFAAEGLERSDWAPYPRRRAL